MSKKAAAEYEEPAPVIIDNRRSHRVPLPTAQELLDLTNAQDGEMTEEEKEALLAQQAEELEEVPYEGAGLKVDAKPEKPTYRTAFTVLLPIDGPPLIVAADPRPPSTEPLTDEDVAFFVQRSPANRDFFLACTEIARDVTAAETAMVTNTVMTQQAVGMAQQQQARMDAAQALQRAQRRH